MKSLSAFGGPLTTFGIGLDSMLRPPGMVIYIPLPTMLLEMIDAFLPSLTSSTVMFG